MAAFKFFAVTANDRFKILWPSAEGRLYSVTKACFRDVKLHRRLYGDELGEGKFAFRPKPDLLEEYLLTKSELDPDWQEIRPAARAAWDRVDRDWNANQ